MSSHMERHRAEMQRQATGDDQVALAQAVADAPKYAELIALNNKIRPGN